MRIWLNNLWQQCLITADEAKTRSVRALGSSSHSIRSTGPLQLDHLEPRILFSATPIDPAMLEGGDEAAMVATVDLDETTEAFEMNAESTTTLVEASPREIVIIDGGVDDIEQLLDDLNASDRNIEVFVLDSERDGIDQITEILDGRTDVDSLHIVSHGSDGSVKLGNVWLSDQNVDAYAGQIATWQGSFSSEADLLFYGCNLAGNTAGQELVESLSVLSGTDVAASVDDTGHESLGGDWDLEFAVGSIETDLVFSMDLQSNWSDLMAIQTVRDNFGSDSYSINDGSVAWSGSWTENDTSGGGSSGGNIKIDGAFGLRLKTWSSSENIYRQVDLSTAVWATLTYNVDSGMSGDTTRVEISSNGGSSWTTLIDYSSTVDTFESFDITAYASVNTQIRFRSMSNGNDSIYFDNIQIEYDDVLAPGGVESDLNLWLRADAGVSTSGGKVDQWDNQIATSPLTDVSASSGERPTFNASTLNFNPVISFDGIDDHLAATSIIGSALFSSNATSIYTVTSLNNTGEVILQWEDNVLGTSNRVNIEDELRFDFGDLTADKYTTASPTDGYHILNAVATPSSPVNLSFNVDGLQTTPLGASGNNPLTLTNPGDFFLGQYPGGSYNDDIDLGEVIIFGSDLSAPEQARVDSYLAIKYGITLDQTAATDYVDSQGTVVWDAATNATYNQDIAGIGRDLTSTLDQTQSRTINGDALVTMSAAADQQNREFLVWGNDGGARVETAVGNPAGVTQRLERIWRVDETGDVGTTTIEFDLTGQTYTGVDASQFHLIVDSDTTFSSGATLYTAASYNAVTEVVTFTGINLTDGEYFALGTAITGMAPTADASAGGPYVTIEGGGITFDGSNSSDPDPGETALLTYQWDVLNDGSFEKSGINASFNWAELNAAGVIDNGSFDVALRITDPNTVFDTVVFSMTVDNVAPDLSVTGTGTVTEDASYSITLSASDPGNDPVQTWYVDWGDGTSEEFNTPFPPTFEHTYDRAGTYGILVAAYDGDGTWVQNDIYVAGFLGTGQIFQFDGQTGTQLNQFGSGGSFNGPTDVVVGPNGNLFSAAYNSFLVREFDPSGTPDSVFASGLNFTRGLAFDANDNLWITHSNKLVQLDPTGTTELQSINLGFWGSGIDFAANGDLYIAGYYTGDLYIYDGTSVSWVDTNMSNPEQVAVGSDGNIYVADSGNQEIKIFDPSGALVDSFAVVDNVPTAATPYGITHGPDGLLYITTHDANLGSDANDRIMRFEHDGSNWVYKDDFTNGGMSGVNLDNAYYLTFMPEHQVVVEHVADEPSITAASTDEHTQTSSGLVITRNPADGDEVTHYKITGITGGTLYKNDGVTQITDGTFITVAEGAAGLKFTPSGDFNDLVGTATFNVQASLAGNDTGLGGGLAAASISISEINDEPVRSGGTVGNLSVNEDSGFTTLGLGGLAYGPGGGADEAGQTLTYAVTTVPAPALGSIYLSDETTVVSTGTYTLAQIQGMKFKPVDQANGGPVTFEWTVTDNGTTNGGADPLVLTESLTITVNAQPDLPEIDGVGDNSINDTATVQSFGSVTIDDADGDNVTTVVTLSAGDANGLFTAASLMASGFTKTGVGEYTLAAGTPAAAQTAIRQLVFDPTENQVASGTNQVTTFTISVNDGAPPVTDNTTDVTVTSVNDAPTIGAGTLSAVTEDDTNPSGATVTSLFGGSFSDVDASSSLDGVAVVGNAANPTTEGAWQYSSNGGTNWFDIGSVDDTGNGLAIDAGSKIRFVPVLDFNGTPTSLVVRGLDDSFAGSYSTTAGSETREVVDTSSPVATSPFSNSTTTLGTSVDPDAEVPTIGATADSSINDTATAQPFSAVTIGEPDGENVTVTITLSGGDTNGLFTAASLSASGFTKTGVGQYSLGSSSAVAAQTAIRQLIFDPTENQVASGSTVMTTFTISVSDGVAPAVNGLTDVTVTSVNDAPSIGPGTLSASAENDFLPPGATVNSLFGGGFSDVDASSSLSGIAVVGNTANAITQGFWQYSSDGATWFNIGAVDDVGNGLTIAAGSKIRFVPVLNFNGTPTSLVVRGLDDSFAGSFSTTAGSENRQFLDTSTPTGNSPFSNPTTTLGTAVAANAAPTINGTASSQAVDDNQTKLPFGNVTITDTEGDNLTTVVTLNGGDANGTFTAASLVSSGFVKTGAGEYTHALSSPAAAQAGIRLLEFDPTENQVAAGSTVTTTFTIVVDDGVPTGNGDTTVVATSINNSPTIGNASLAASDEDVFTPPGATVDTLVGGSFADPDSASSLSGIVIVGNSANPVTQGDWQYSSDGMTWYRVGSVSDSGNGLAIAAGSRIRFVPVGDFSGTPGGLVVRGLDNSYAGAFSDTSGSETRETIDTSTPISTSPFAASTSTIGTSINPMNDAPTLADRTINVTAGTKLLANNSLFVGASNDIDGDGLFATFVAGTSNGTFFLNADGSFTYTPNAGFTGRDSFQWQAFDGADPSLTASVTIEVKAAIIPIRPPVDPTDPTPDPTTDPTPDPDPDDDSSDDETEDEIVTPPPTDTSTTAGEKEKPPSGPVDVLAEDKTEKEEIVASVSLSSVVMLPQETNESASDALVQSEERIDDPRSMRLRNSLDGTLSQIDVSMMSGAGEMWDQMDEQRQLIDSHIQGDIIVVGAAGAAASTFTVGYVAWAIRSGFILSGLLAQMPAWQSIDPLLIMQGLSGTQKSETLEEMMDRKAKGLKRHGSEPAVV